MGLIRALPPAFMWFSWQLSRQLSNSQAFSAREASSVNTRAYVSLMRDSPVQKGNQQMGKEKWFSKLHSTQMIEIKL